MKDREKTAKDGKETRTVKFSEIKSVFRTRNIGHIIPEERLNRELDS